LFVVCLYLPLRNSLKRVTEIVENLIFFVDNSEFIRFQATSDVIFSHFDSLNRLKLSLFPDSGLEIGLVQNLTFPFRN